MSAGSIENFVGSRPVVLELDNSGLDPMEVSRRSTRALEVSIKDRLAQAAEEGSTHCDIVDEYLPLSEDLYVAPGYFD